MTEPPKMGFSHSWTRPFWGLLSDSIYGAETTKTHRPHWGCKPAVLWANKDGFMGPFIPIGSMVLLYMVTWIPSICCTPNVSSSIYTSTMDPMGYNRWSPNIMGILKALLSIVKHLLGLHKPPENWHHYDHHLQVPNPTGWSTPFVHLE